MDQREGEKDRGGREGRNACAGKLFASHGVGWIDGARYVGGEMSLGYTQGSCCHRRKS